MQSLSSSAENVAQSTGLQNCLDELCQARKGLKVAQRKDPAVTVSPCEASVSLATRGRSDNRTGAPCWWLRAISMAPSVE